MESDIKRIEKQLKSVQTMMVDSLRGTNIAKLLPPRNNIMGSGKMLRAQLTLFLSPANRIDEKTALHAAAAVEAEPRIAPMHTSSRMSRTASQTASATWSISPSASMTRYRSGSWEANGLMRLS